MSSLEGKVALVTGGSKGIGRATCQALANAGASVAINYASDSSSADKLVEELGSGHAFAIQADAGSVQGAEHMVKSTLDRFGRLDVLVLSAGAFGWRFVREAVTAENLIKVLRPCTISPAPRRQISIQQSA